MGAYGIELSIYIHALMKYYLKKEHSFVIVIKG